MTATSVCSSKLWVDKTLNKKKKNKNLRFFGDNHNSEFIQQEKTLRYLQNVSPGYNNMLILAVNPSQKIPKIFSSKSFAKNFQKSPFNCPRKSLWSKMHSHPVEVLDGRLLIDKSKLWLVKKIIKCKNENFWIWTFAWLFSQSF